MSSITTASHILATIQRAVRELGMPAPVHYRIDGRTITLGFATPADVDAWQRHIGLPPAWHTGLGEYGTVDFHVSGGWCGASVVTISCPTPRAAAEVPA